ncbi:MAG: LysR family transcriptional regulator [Bacteriovoracaceae bacterium]|nr:LysR family transcriptional regulator [Bacteriovoracaceae bacterium]
MSVSQLSLRDIEYIVAVAEELHFGRAAKRLNVSQPTLSEQIKKLETNLELKIFERSKRSVQLTGQGSELIEIGKKILREAEAFLSLAQNKKNPLTGVFNLGAIATVGPYYLPYIIGPLRKAYPQLELIIEEGQTDELLQKLDNGELDAVIASRTFDESPYRVYPLYKEDFWLGAPADLKVKLRGGKVSVNDVDKEHLVLLTDGNCLKDEVLDFCRIPRKSNSKVQASSLETLKYLVAAGNGTTFIPQLALADNKKMKGLISYYPFIEKSAHREIALVTRDQYSRPDEIRLLLQKMKENLPKF